MEINLTEERVHLNLIQSYIYIAEFVSLSFYMQVNEKLVKKRQDIIRFNFSISAVSIRHDFRDGLFHFEIWGGGWGARIFLATSNFFSRFAQQIIFKVTEQVFLESKNLEIRKLQFIYLA